eukprot:4897400-Prymnesium_polylepis.1
MKTAVTGVMKATALAADDWPGHTPESPAPEKMPELGRGDGDALVLMLCVSSRLRPSFSASSLIFLSSLILRRPGDSGMAAAAGCGGLRHSKVQAAQCRLHTVRAEAFPSQTRALGPLL